MGGKKLEAFGLVSTTNTLTLGGVGVNGSKLASHQFATLKSDSV